MLFSVKELKELKARLKAVEDLAKETKAGLGVLYSKQQLQIDKLSLQVKELKRALRSIIPNQQNRLVELGLQAKALTQALRKLHPEFGPQYAESCSELKRSSKPSSKGESR